MVRLLHLPQRDGDTLHDGADGTDGRPAARRCCGRSPGTRAPRWPATSRITDRLGAPVYFCDSHSPWQRGCNENTNGLLRDYFPKGTDLSIHTPEHLLAVENELNNRPTTRPRTTAPRPSCSPRC